RVRDAVDARGERVEHRVFCPASGSPALEHVDLQEADRIDVRVAQPNGAPKDPRCLEQLALTRELEHEIDTALVLAADHREEPLVQRPGELRVQRRDVEVSLSERDADVGEQHVEERPLLEHFDQRLLAMLVERDLEARADAEPAPQETAVLEPREGPERGARLVARRAELLRALRRAADSLDHVDRRRGAEVAHEVAGLEQHDLIRAAALDAYYGS